jgi:hypothetical protein
MTDHTDQRRCTATAKRTGERCKRAPVPGANVCVKHGGGAPQVQAAAQRRLLEQRAKATIASLGGEVPPLGDPLSQLEALGAELVATKDWMRNRVAELRSPGYSSAQGLEQVKAEWQLYVSLATRVEATLSKIIALDIAGRRLALDEAKARLVASALAKVLSSPRLQLDPERQRIAKQMLARELGAPAAAVEAVSTASLPPAALAEPRSH